MKSLLKIAVLGTVLAVPLSLDAAASAPFDHDAKRDRAAPIANQDLRGSVRYARSRAIMNDSWDEAPRRVQRPQVRQRRAARPVRARPHRQAVQRRAVVAQRPVRRQRVAAHVPSGHAGSGMASYYWQGQRTASGAAFNPDGLTAAHRTLPFGTRVRVTHAGNGRSVDVIINDRGPFIGGRVIDLSRGAARVIGMTGQGVASVRMEVLGR